MATAIPSKKLGRSAARPSKRGAKPTPTLRVAAEAGILTRANTEPGTRGRQAVDRLTYERRTRNLKPGETVSEAAGHSRPEVQQAAAIQAFVGDGFAILDAPTRLEMKRAGRYGNAVHDLASGRISDKQFRRRVESWAPIRGERFLSDPDKVLAIMEARRAAGEESFVYVSGRAA